jgi:hypothetical protein
MLGAAVDGDFVQRFADHSKVGVSDKRSIRLATDEAVTSGHQQPAIRQEVDAVVGRLRPFGDHFAVAVDVNGSDLLRAPVAEPEAAVMPTRRLVDRATAARTPHAGPREGPIRPGQLLPRQPATSRRRDEQQILELLATTRRHSNQEQSASSNRSGCQMHGHRPIWLLHRRRMSEFTDRSQAASKASRDLYSSSSWLYTTRISILARKTAFVLASSIWLHRGPAVNDLMTIVKFRQNAPRPAVVPAPPQVWNPQLQSRGTYDHDGRNTEGSSTSPENSDQSRGLPCPI